MNIAFVTNVMYPFVKGGAEKRVYEVGTRLTERGHTITVYSRHWWDGDAEQTYDGLQLRAVVPSRQLHNDANRRSIAEGVEFARLAIPKVRRHIDEHDILVVSNAPYYPAFATKLSAVFTGTPFVTIWQEVWKDHWYEYLGRVGMFGRLTEYVAANVPQHYIAASDVTADRLADIGPPRGEISVITNGIDVAQISAIDPVDEGFDILFAGRIAPNKNVHLLMEAFNQVAANHDVTLGIIGDGPQLAELKLQQTELKHSDRITFLGFLEAYEDVLAHMRAAPVFVSPSVREGFGITLAEAMAADCLVITSDHDFSAGRNVVADAGFAVEPSVDPIRTAIEDALDGNRPQEDPQEAVRAYDWEYIVDEEEALYRSLLGT